MATLAEPSASAMELVKPLYHSGPKITDTLGPEVADLNDFIGYAPDPEQEMILDAIFALDEEGRSQSFEIMFEAPRQNLKTGVMKQALIGWMFLTQENLMMWTAHEFATAQEAFRDVQIMIEDAPVLKRRVDRYRFKSGAEGIELAYGGRVMFRSRTAVGGLGMTGDKIIVDEAFALKPEHLGALIPTLSARPDPQIVGGTSAGDEVAHEWHRIRDRGRAGKSKRLTFFEWSAPRAACAEDECSHLFGKVEGCQLDNRDHWKVANPLLGRRRANGTGLTYDYVQAEREALSPEQFMLMRLGWDDDPGAAAIFGPGMWEKGSRNARPEELNQPHALGVAVSIDLEWASIVGAAQDSDGNNWIIPLAHDVGLDWVVEEAKRLQQKYKITVGIDGRGPAASLIPQMKKQRISMKVLSTEDVLVSCAQIYTRVRAGTLLHTPADELTEAVGGAVKRPVGDRWAWGRKGVSAVVSPLEAGTIASWLVDNPRRRSAYESDGEGVQSI